MNVEPQTHGLPDWHFPSPSSTPKSAYSHQATLQTPKVKHPSHFLDAYYTPQITGQQTPDQTPTYNSFTVVKRPAPPSPLTPDDPSFHINHFKGSHLPLPPVEPARRLTSSPDPATLSTTPQRASSAPKVLEGAMNHFQMQTPPPTRDSSSRRQAQNGQQGASYNIPPVGYQGQASTPVRHPPQQSMQTPQFQANFQTQELQFTPEMFQYGGPTSAPPMPLDRTPWDQSPTMIGYSNDGMMDAQQHAFGPGTSFNHAFQDWRSQDMSTMQPQGGLQAGFQQQQYQQPPQQLQMQLQQQPLSQNFSMPMQEPNQSLDFWTTPAMHSQPAGSFSQDTSSFASTSTTTAVNPSMLFSFTSPPPQKAETVSVRPQLTQRMVDTGGRQPYEHQMRESSREKEIAATRKSKAPIRSSSGSSSASLPNTGRSTLQRSNTDSAVRRASHRSLDSQRSMQSTGAIVRRSSPLKRNSSLPLQAIPESRPKLTTRLVVDENGRARTETVDSAEEERLDPKKSPGFWIGDDDDSEDDAMLISQRNSFAYPSDQLKRRPSKHARTGSDPERFDPMKRPVSSASMASLTNRLEATPIGKRTSATTYKRASSGSFASTLSADNIRAIQESDADEESSDAQGALRKLMEGRRRKGKSTLASNLYRIANQEPVQIKIILKSSLVPITNDGPRPP
ncbi:hypothetical protein FKW77_005499 [Venturia effusa]|uniref:Uncharacterized protein n=1 Tax=Venturia effusa TaxID=50376 RepID=A0A517LQ74_9PEZI|nr:hypothetical protein FKW77_005499 [Venturia effusa]